MSNEIGKFMVAVGAIIEDDSTGKILLLKRTSDNDYFSGGIWEYITGRMNQFEDPVNGLHREIMEEAGIEVEVGKPLSIYHIFRGEEKAENELVGIIYRCTAKTTSVKLSEEHTDFKWLSPRDAIKIIENPGMKATIQTFIYEKNAK